MRAFRKIMPAIHILRINPILWHIINKTIYSALAKICIHICTVVMVVPLYAIWQQYINSNDSVSKVKEVKGKRRMRNV